jgi:hypothetical protein
VLAANYLQLFKRAVVELDSAAPGITLQQLQVILTLLLLVTHVANFHHSGVSLHLVRQLTASTTKQTFTHVSLLRAHLDVLYCCL